MSTFRQRLSSALPTRDRKLFDIIKKHGKVEKLSALSTSIFTSFKKPTLGEIVLRMKEIDPDYYEVGLNILKDSKKNCSQAEEKCHQEALFKLTEFIQGESREMLNDINEFKKANPNDFKRIADLKKQMMDNQEEMPEFLPKIQKSVRPFISENFFSEENLTGGTRRRTKKRSSKRRSAKKSRKRSLSIKKKQSSRRRH